MSSDVESGSGLYFIPKIPFRPVASYSQTFSNDNFNVQEKIIWSYAYLPIFNPFFTSC